MTENYELDACKAEVARLNRQVNKLLPAFSVHRDVNWLAPICRAKFVKLRDILARDFKEKKTKSNFRVFETYRTPMRQQYLFEHTKSTKAQAWQSAHNFGLAADFVPMDPDGLWSWRDDEDWLWLGHRARECGLSQPIKWDRPHICALEWQGVYEAMT